MGKHDTIKIDVSQIPEADARLLAATFLEAAKRFYSDPENRKRAEIWIREQEAKKAEKNDG